MVILKRLLFGESLRSYSISICNPTPKANIFIEEPIASVPRLSHMTGTMKICLEPVCLRKIPLYITLKLT